MQTEIREGNFGKKFDLLPALSEGPDLSCSLHASGVSQASLCGRGRKTVEEEKRSSFYSPRFTGGPLNQTDKK